MKIIIGHLLWMNLLAMQQKYIIKHFMKITIDNFTDLFIFQKLILK